VENIKAKTLSDDFDIRIDELPMSDPRGVSFYDICCIKVEDIEYKKLSSHT